VEGGKRDETEGGGEGGREGGRDVFIYMTYCVLQLALVKGKKKGRKEERQHVVTGRQKPKTEQSTERNNHDICVFVCNSLFPKGRATGSKLKQQLLSRFICVSFSFFVID
jgi:hypothetical protein